MYWSYQMTIARGLSYDKRVFAGIFRQARMGYPRYGTYDYHRAIFLLPRWGGGPGEWENELEKSADELGGDAGDELYAQTVWRVHEYGGTQKIFEESELSWPRVDKGFALIEKEYPGSMAAKNERTHLAVLARDKEKARQYFGETGGEIDLASWRSADNYIRMAAWAYSR